MSGIDFSALRKNKGGNMAALQANLDANGQRGFQKDERLWRPQPNRQNVCECVVRFLPIPKVDMQAANDGKILKEDLTPVATVVKHWFKGPTGKNYIEMSPKTFGDECPVHDHDIPLMASTKNLGDKEKKQKRIELGLADRRARTERTANILVIKDSTNPENEGKVMLWAYGAEIQKKIDATQEKKFSTDVVFDPFCPFEGADLILNLEFEEKNFGNGPVKVPDYKVAKWGEPRCLGDDEEIAKIWEQEHSIAAFMDRTQVKSYEELQKKFFEVMDYDEEGNPKGSAKGMSKSADEMMDRMNMAAENAGVGEVKGNAGAQQQSQQSDDAPEQKSVTPEAESKQPEPEPEPQGGGDLAEFEQMLASM